MLRSGLVCGLLLLLAACASPAVLQDWSSPYQTHLDPGLSDLLSLNDPGTDNLKGLMESMQQLKLREKLEMLQDLLQNWNNEQSTMSVGSQLASGKWSDYVDSLADAGDDMEGYLRVKPKSKRMEPRAMRNVLSTMPAEMMTHILQSHRPQEAAGDAQSSTSPPGNLRGGSLSVSLDLETLSGMFKAMLRRKNHGQRLKLSHKKLLDIGK